MIVFLIAIVLGMFSTTFAILKAPTPQYTSICSVKFEKQTTVEGLYARTISWSMSDDIETQLSMIRSYFVFQKVAEKLSLIAPMGTKEDGLLKYKIIGTVDNLLSKVKVTRENRTNILNIAVTDTNPLLAQKLANTIALTYKELHAEQQMKRTTEAIKYIADQLREERRKLRESEEELNGFRQDNQLISIDMQSEDLLARIQEVRNEVGRLQRDKMELEGILLRLNQFIEKPTDSKDNFYASKASRRYQATEDTLVGLLLKMDTLLKDYTPNHPEVVAINREIKENARKMVILLQLQTREMDKKEIELKKDLEKVDKKTRSLMDKKLEFSRLKRKVELHNDMTILLEKKNQEALIRKAEKPEEITIVKPALLPSTPTNSPKTVATGAMGVIIGLILGLVIAFVVETFDTSLNAIEDVEEILGTQVLGIVPQADARDIQENLKKKFPEDTQVPPMEQTIYLLSHFAPQSMMAENFRALRTNIQFKDTEKKIKTIAVVSTSPQEGKTLVSVNLAITMAQAGMKTLLIAADLRMPKLSTVFGLERTPGLTDILLGNYPWRETVKTITDIIMGKMTLDQVMITPGLDNLSIITAGPIPPNPADLLDSGRLLDFIEEAKKEYDILIFDSTPILSAADAAILGRRMDGVFLVYRLGSVSRSLLKRSSTQLEQVNCNVMGVILNGMRPEVSPDFHDYKYYKYHYSYGKGGKDERDQKTKKGFSLTRKTKDRQKAGTRRVILKKMQKGHNKLRLSLMVLALALLGAGILWQDGFWDPFKGVGLEKSVKEKEIETKVKERISKPATTKRAGADSVKPKAKVSPGKAGIGVETPSPPSKSLAKEGLEAKAKERLEAKKKISKQATTKGAGADSVKPKAKVSPGKAGIEAETPSPPSKSLAKKLVKVETLPSSEKISSSYPYSLYLGSFRTLKRANKAISIYNQKGLSPYWVKVVFKEKGMWYRVFVGHFDKRKRAEGFKEEHGLPEATIRKTLYASLIGIYTSPNEMEDKSQTLRNLGHFPYAIRGQNGKFRLFVGAFLTRAGVERQNREIKSHGIQSQAVKR